MSNNNDSDSNETRQRESGGAVIQLPDSWVPPSKDTTSGRIELGQLWSSVRERWAMVLGLTALIVTTVATVTFAGHMTFKTRGSLYLGELQDKSGERAAKSDQLELFGGGNGDVGTEIEILKSDDLIKRAILATGLNVKLAPAGWSAPRYLSWRLARRDLNMLDVGTRALVPVNASLPRGTTTAREFKITFVDDKNYRVDSGSSQVGTGTLGSELISSALKLTLVPGTDGHPQAGDTYDMTVSPLDQVAEAVNHALTVATPKAASANDRIKIITVEYVNASPRAAAAFVSALMRTYLERRQSWKSEEATAAESFVAGQVKSMKQSLDAAERDLADYKKGSTVMVLGDDAKGMVDQLARYEEQRMTSRLQLASFNQIDKALKSGRAVPIEQYLVGESADPVLSGLSANLSQAQQELTRMRSRFTEDSPVLREQQNQVDSQLTAVRTYVMGRRTRAQEQLAALDGMISQFESKLKTVPHAEQQLAQLTRNADVLSKMYSLLLERQQQIAVVKASTISKNRILDSAEVPYRENAPVFAVRMALALVFGLLLSVTLVFLRRVAANTFQTEKELRDQLGTIPVFGIIPRQAERARPRRDDSTSPLDAMLADLHSPFAEAFRHLRTNIYYAGPLKDDRVILVTSPSQGDGKTLCTLALAASLAADGKRVLVIEGDLHRPAHEALMNLERGPGFSSLLTRQVEWREVVRSVTTPYGTFDAIPAGTVPPSPTELLSSPQFGMLVTLAKRNYDFVLIDSPPFPSVPDALVMSMHADRILTVARPQNTERRAAEEHLRRFTASTPRYGVVMNAVDAATVVYGYGHHAGRRTTDRHGTRGGRAPKLAVHS